jgi:histidinol-phosphate aminotransferase
MTEATRTDIESLIRPHLRAQPGYSPGASPAGSDNAIRLDWNESPFPPSPKAQQALSDFTSGNRYPDIRQYELREALGQYIGAAAHRVMAGAGLDDVLNTLAMLVIEPGDEVVISDPTFGVYRSLFSHHGAVVRNVPLLSERDFELDDSSVLAEVGPRTKLIIVCNPNNPTGTLFPRDKVERIVTGATCLVAIDEAYAEFSDTAHLDLADSYEHVVVLRTMSKFAGLAGFRVGYGVFPETLMPWLWQVAPPFLNVSAVAVAVALASLQDLPLLENNVAAIVRGREELARDLSSIDGVVVFPSATNFLLVRLPVADAAPIVEALAAENVFVRHFANPALGLRDCLRVSVGTPAENEVFLDRLRYALRIVTAEEAR